MKPYQKHITLTKQVYFKVRSLKYKLQSLIGPLTWDGFMTQTIILWEDYIKGKTNEKLKEIIYGLDINELGGDVE
jgi:hypothetical protein